MLTAFVGPCPPGMMARHRNGNPADNRVENLRWGTQSENMLDAVEHGTHNNARKTHCKRGHPFNEANTMMLSSGSRSCRTCHNARSRKARAKL